MLHAALFRPNVSTFIPVIRSLLCICITDIYAVIEEKHTNQTRTGRLTVTLTQGLYSRQRTDRTQPRWVTPRHSSPSLALLRTSARSKLWAACQLFARIPAHTSLSHSCPIAPFSFLSLCICVCLLDLLHVPGTLSPSLVFGALTPLAWQLDIFS